MVICKISVLYIYRQSLALNARCRVVATQRSPVRQSVSNAVISNLLGFCRWRSFQSFINAAHYYLKEVWHHQICMAILGVERQPGMERLAQPCNGGGGGRGGTQMWRVCRRATQIYPPLLFQWSVNSKTHTHMQGTHTRTLTHKATTLP